MPLPAGVDSVTLTAGANGLRNPDGTAAAGTVTVTPSVERVTSSVHGLIVLGPVNATLGASGTFTLGPVLATDASGFTPSGWTYRIDEDFTGQPPRSYSISLPVAAPSVALPDVAPTSTTAGTVVSPSVLSVNGETGTVTLTAADIGAASTTHAATHAAAGSDPITVAQSQVTGLTTALAAKVAGPASATDNAIARYDGTTGQAVQDSTVTIDDTGAVTVAGAATFNGSMDLNGVTHANNILVCLADSTANDVFAVRLNTDTARRLHIHADGLVHWGDGANAADTNLYRAGVDTLATDDDFLIQGVGKGYRLRRGGSSLDLEATGSDMLISNWSGTNFNGTQHAYIRLSADAQNVQVAGKVEFVDTLYGTTRHVIDGAGNTLGFHAATPVGQQTVTGSKADGTALADLLTKLAAVGLLVDGTTA